MFHGIIVRFLPVFVLCVLGATVLVAGSDTYGDDGGEQAPPIGEKGTPEYPNLDSHLRALLEAFEAEAYSGDDAVGAPEDGLPPVGPMDPADLLPTVEPGDPGDGLPTDGEKGPADGPPPVDVTIYVIGDIKAVASFLTSNGASVRNIGSTYLEASVPVALLGEASQQPGVIRVEPVIGPHPEDDPFSSLPTGPKDIGGATKGPWDDAPWISEDGLSVAASGSEEDAPQIPGKAPQRFANLTSDLDGIAKDVDDGVFSADSLAESALLYEGPEAVADVQSGDEVQSVDDEAASVGVTIYALEDIGAAADFLKRNGVAIRHQGETYLEAYVPVGLLGQASMQPDVIRIEPIVGPWVDQMTDPCIVDLGTLTPPVSRSESGSWTSQCTSENRTGRYARYYSFTLAQNTPVTIDLTSSDADTYLYLMRGVGKSGDIVASNDDGGAGVNSRIVHTLRPGQYTIEATTYGPRDTGSFTLAIDASPLNICEESLGEISGTQTVSRTGTWAIGCDSANLPGRYARYYGFTLTAQTVMTIDITSPDTYPYLYLIRGEGTEAIIDHDVIARSLVNISLVLQPGAYTIQATTYRSRATGNFTLEIDAWLQNVCIENLGGISGTQTVSRTGTWARGCDSVNRVARYAQYYSFTLTNDAIVTFDLTSPTSGADPYLYLIRGAGVGGTIFTQTMMEAQAATRR